MAHSLPLHSILLPRRFIHVDDKRKILLAGCGPYIDRFDLSPSPVLRSRLRVFDNGEDVEGLVRVKGTPHFVAFSHTRLALVHKDNLKNGGILVHLQISESIDEIRQVISAQFVKEKLEVLLLTASPLEMRKIVLVPVPFLHCSAVETIDITGEEESLSPSEFPSSTKLYVNISGGSILSTVLDRSLESGDVDEYKFMREAIKDDSEDKALLSVDMKDNKILIHSGDRRQYKHTFTIGEKMAVTERIEAIPIPEEQRNRGRPILVALSEDCNHYAIANSDKSIEYSTVGKLSVELFPQKIGALPPHVKDSGDYTQMAAATCDKITSTQIHYDSDRTTTSKKQFFSTSRITSLACAGKGKNVKIYYGTERGELSSIPVSFFDDDNSQWIIAGCWWERKAAGEGRETKGEVRAKEVIGFGLVYPFITWLASDGSVYSASSSLRGGALERIGAVGVYRRIASCNSEKSGCMAAFSPKNLLVYTGIINIVSVTIKQYSLKSVSLVAVAVSKQYICMQSRDGTRYDASFYLTEGRAKRERTPLLTQMTVTGDLLHMFVVGFDNGTIGLLCGALSRAKVQQPNIDSLFTSGMALDMMKISDEGEDSPIVRMGRFGSANGVYALASSGRLFRFDDAFNGSKMWLAETVSMERMVSITALPDGDLLVCGFREGVFVGVSLSSLRLLFSLACRRNLLTPSISQCTVILKDNKFRITALNGQTLVVIEEPCYGEKTLTVLRALHSEKIVAQTFVYIGFGGNEMKASYESGHALITASVDGHVVVSSLWSNGRLVPLHRFRAPGVTCLAAFSYASQRCASCVDSETACSHRKATTETHPRVLDRPWPQSLRLETLKAISSLHMAARPSLHGLVRATVFIGSPVSTGLIEMSAQQKVVAFSDVATSIPVEEKSNRMVRNGLVAVGFDDGRGTLSDPVHSLDSEMILAHPLVHSSAGALVGSKATVILNRFVYTSGSFRPRKGSLIGTKAGDIFLWGIVEETSTPEKRRMAVSLARRGDETRLPSEDGMVEEKEAKWGVVARWTPPSKEIGEVVALSSTLSPSSAATTIAALFSTGKSAVFLLALDKLVFVQWLETTVKDPVGISVTLQGTDNLNSRCSSQYPSSVVVSGGNSIEVVRIAKSSSGR